MSVEVKTNHKHIAVLAFPFAAHPAALLRLVRSLSAAALDAEFSFFSTVQSNAIVFANQKELKNVKPRNVSDGIPDGHVFSGHPQEPVEMFLQATPGNFKEAIKEAIKETGKGITCLITDAFIWFAAEMAEEMRVPWVPIWTGGLFSVLMHVETELIRQKMGLSESSVIRAVDVPEGIISGDLNSPFATMLQKMGQMLPHATAVAINSFETLEPVSMNVLKSRFQKLLNVGPFVLTSPDPNIGDPQGCLEWLGKQMRRSVVYVSFGSVVCPLPHELEALAQALEECGFPFIWSLRGNPEAMLPKEFLERTKDQGKIVPWAPQLEVLQHHATGVFITHGGWNSILESIIGGVPMICRPFFGDQPLNTRFVEAVWKIGVGIEGGKITEDSTMKALNQVLSTEEGKSMRMKLEVLRNLALDAVQPNGSSMENMKALVQVVTM